MREVLEVGEGVSGLAPDRRVSVSTLRQRLRRVAGNTAVAMDAQFDIRNWGFLYATLSGRSIAAAAIAWNTPNLAMLEGALMWRWSGTYVFILMCSDGVSAVPMCRQ